MDFLLLYCISHIVCDCSSYMCIWAQTHTHTTALLFFRSEEAAIQADVFYVLFNNLLLLLVACCLLAVSGEGSPRCIRARMPTISFISQFIDPFVLLFYFVICVAVRCYLRVFEFVSHRSAAANSILSTATDRK